MILIVAMSDGGDDILEDVVMLAVVSGLVVETTDIVSAAIYKGGEDVEPVLEAATDSLFIEYQIQSTWKCFSQLGIAEMQFTAASMVWNVQVSECAVISGFPWILSV